MTSKVFVGDPHYSSNKEEETQSWTPPHFWEEDSREEEEIIHGAWQAGTASHRRRMSVMTYHEDKEELF